MIDSCLSNYIRHVFGDMDCYLDVLFVLLSIHLHSPVLPQLYFERNIPSLIWNEIEVLWTLFCKIFSVFQTSLCCVGVEMRCLYTSVLRFVWLFWIVLSLIWKKSAVLNGYLMKKVKKIFLPTWAKIKKPYFGAWLKGENLCSWGSGNYPQQAKMKISRQAGFFIFERFVCTDALLAKECIENQNINIVKDP